MANNRFNDENKTLSDFLKEVLVVCPSCGAKAVATTDHLNYKARLVCVHCSYNKDKNTKTKQDAHIKMPAHLFFDVELWLSHPFKNESFYAFNYRHLSYLEQYIQATLREHKMRDHFTLLEKLPKFYHESANRGALLKIIQKLKSK